MEIVNRKDSKLLGRSEVQVLFAGKAGAINRKEAIKEVAQSLGSSESRVTLVKLAPQAGSRDLVGWFHVYQTEDGRKLLAHEYLSTRLLTKEEREAAKAAKKKADAAAAAAAAPAAKKKK
jgi:ribosomal protein S24E